MQALPVEPFPGYHEALDLCIADLEALSEAIAEALRRHAISDAAGSAHAMRGLAANFAVEELLGPLHLVEAACRAGDGVAALSAAATLQHELVPAIQRLRQAH